MHPSRVATQVRSDPPLDYDRAATYYDATRGASPSLVEAILKDLGPARGRTLLEVGCGTGNYARAFAAAGFHVLGIDGSRGMLRQATGKIPGRAILGTADWIPLPSRSVDCLVTVNVFHHLADPLASFREFHRVVRDRVVHHLTAGEQYQAHWALHYFPLLRHEQPGEHATRPELVAVMREAGFLGAEAVRFDYTDTIDASFMPLRHASPQRLLDTAFRRGVSTFRRLTPQEDADGAAALAADLAAGKFEQVQQQYARAWRAVGDSTLLVGRARVD